MTGSQWVCIAAMLCTAFVICFTVWCATRSERPEPNDDRTEFMS